MPNAFTESQLRELRRTSLARIICDNLDDAETIQPWVMLQPDSKTYYNFYLYLSIIVVFYYYVVSL